MEGKTLEKVQEENDLGLMVHKAMDGSRQVAEALRNFGNSVNPAFPMSFGGDPKSLEKDNSLNHSYSSPMMVCLEYPKHN